LLNRVKKGEVRLNEEAQEFAWVDLDEVENYPVDKYLKYALERVQANPQILE